jgi:hypothetical protein
VLSVAILFEKKKLQALFHSYKAFSLGVLCFEVKTLLTQLKAQKSSIFFINLIQPLNSLEL